jgi:biopolymer transport protein ExbD
MGMSLGGNGKPRAEINMTPMIDVLLVMIIIFMVITPTNSRGLKTLLPQDSASIDPPAPEVSHDIVITVHRDGVVDLNREALDIPRLRERLLRIFSQQGVANVVFVKGDRDLDFASIAQVIDLTKAAGVSRIALMPN